MRTFRNAIIILLGVLGTGLLTLFVLARIYEEDVKAALINALNDRLDTPVSVSGVDLTLIARFPNASLRLHDVFIREVRSDELPPDSLLAARELHLEFSLWDLFRGEQTVQRIHGEQVHLYPGIDRNGTYTHLIWKNDSTDTGSTDIALERVSMSDARLRFRDGRSGLEVAASSNNIQLGGRFNDAENALSLSGDLHLKHWRQGADTILVDRTADLRLDLVFGGEEGAFRITHGEVVANKVALEVMLDLVPEGTSERLDLRANGLGIDLGRALALLPNGLLPDMERYDISGEADVAVRYSGPLAGDGPALSVGAKVSAGRLKERRSGTVFTEVQGELSLDLSSKGTPRTLHIRRFSARSGSGSLRGEWHSDGLANAPMKADLQVDIGMADLLRFARVDTLEQVTGRLKADLLVEGRLRDMADLKAQDLRALRIGGDLALRDATLKLKGIRHRVEDLNAELSIDGNDAVIRGLAFSLQGDPIELKGRLANLLPYLLFEGQLLTIQAEGRADRIDLAALLRDPNTAPPKPGEEEKGYTLTLPATIALDVKARVERLEFEEFQATALNGTLRMRDQRLSLSPVTFNTASGAVLGRLDLDARGPGPYPLSITATFQDIDITQFFREFQDFGQDFIGHQHLSGRTQAKITLDAPLSPTLSIDLDHLVCVADIAVDKGGITGHAPLIAVADHLKGNRLVAPFVNIPELRKRLTDVRFDRLENRIEVRDGAVHIPTMEVRTSAMDLEVSGTHHFDDRVNYHLNFRLSDLFRIGKPTRDEFGPIIDDGTGMRIFLRMHGTVDDLQFSNDGALAAERRRQQFQQEKQELKSVLREGFGIGRGSGTEPDKPEQPEPTIRVEWGNDTVPEQPVDRTRRDRGRQREKPKEEQERFRIDD